MGFESLPVLMSPAAGRYLQQFSEVQKIPDGFPSTWLNLNHCEYKNEEFTLALKPHGPVRLDRQWGTMSITVYGSGL